MKLYCEVNLKDRTPSSIRDAIAYASRHDELWKVRLTKEEVREMITSRTNLDGKCGSCEYFELFGRPYCGSNLYGECKKGHTCGARSRRACKEYERKTEE